MNNGAFGENFPYSNFHDLNMDWIIKIAKDFLDQYTHIQEVIADGEQSLTDLTESGLAQLQEKADNLEALLQAWYDEHSQDIADQLADALADLNEWYTEHEDYLDQTLQDNITAFNTAAAEKAALTIASIPSDYTNLSKDVTDAEDSMQFLTPYAVPMTWRSAGHTGQGYTWTYTDPYTYHVVGQNTTATFLNVYEFQFLSLAGVKTGDNIFFYINSSDEDSIYMNLWWRIGDSYRQHFAVMKNGYSSVKIPSDATGLTWRIYVPARSEALDATITAKLITLPFTHYTVTSFTTSALGEYGETIDLNDLYHQNRWYSISQNRTYLHLPSGFTGLGFLYCVYTGNADLQIIVPWTGAIIYKRRGFNLVWEDWQTLQGGGSSEIVNEYVYNNYNNSYNITSSPVITTDTNNFLPSTNDTTDRTADIMTMLNATGFCQLGPGYFYVSGIEIPNNATLRGCGTATRIILDTSVTNGYAVKLKTYGKIEDVLIDGNPAGTVIPIPETVGTRNGVIFEGTADAQANPVTYYRSSVINCMIRNFTGSGIKMYNTGYTVACNLEISNCFIYNCGAGINIAYFSEFHRISNTTCQFCLYGCIDNGGNNNFSNCDFSGNKIGVLMDNQYSQSRNNSHGTFSSCSIHHSDSNNGVALRILNCQWGEVFTGLQISNGAIEIDSSKGIQFVGMNCGNLLPITITDSTSILFSNCYFMNETGSVLTQSGNTSLIFTNCYLSNGNTYNPME